MKLLEMFTRLFKPKSEVPTAELAIEPQPAPEVQEAAPEEVQPLPITLAVSFVLYKNGQIAIEYESLDEDDASAQNMSDMLSLIVTGEMKPAVFSSLVRTAAASQDIKQVQFYQKIANNLAETCEKREEEQENDEYVILPSNVFTHLHHQGQQEHA